MEHSVVVAAEHLKRGSTLLRSLQSSQCNDENDAHVSPGTIVCLAVTACFFFCCGPTLIGYLKECCLARQIQLSPSQQESPSSSGNTPSDERQGEVSQSLEQRKSLIDTILIAKKYEKTEPRSDGSITNTSTSSDDGNDCDSNKSQEFNTTQQICSGHLKSQVSAAPEHEDDEEDCCIICLNRYEEGDIIACSYNSKCKHVFHRQCIAAWLLKNDGCPICRNDFMSESWKLDKDESNSNSSIPPATSDDISDDHVIQEDAPTSTSSSAQGREDSSEATILRGLSVFLHASRLTTTTAQQYHPTSTTNSPEDPEQQQGLRYEGEDESSEISQTNLNAASMSMVGMEELSASSANCFLTVYTVKANDGNDAEPTLATNL